MSTDDQTTAYPAANDLDRLPVPSVSFKSLGGGRRVVVLALMIVGGLLTCFFGAVLVWFGGNAAGPVGLMMIVLGAASALTAIPPLDQAPRSTAPLGRRCWHRPTDAWCAPSAPTPIGLLGTRAHAVRPTMSSSTTAAASTASSRICVRDRCSFGRATASWRVNRWARSVTRACPTHRTYTCTFSKPASISASSCPSYGPTSTPSRVWKNHFRSLMNTRSERNHVFAFSLLRATCKLIVPNPNRRSQSAMLTPLSLCANC